MTARQWKPGDVAVVTDKQGRTGRGICNVKGGWDFTEEGASLSSYSMAHEIVAARPLVVIDLDDEEQMEHLADAWHDAEPTGGSALRMQTALRMLSEGVTE